MTKKLIAAVLAVAAMALTAPAPAAADPETAYLKAVHARGISMDGGDQAITEFGHTVCGALSAGYSMNALIDLLHLHERDGMTDDDMEFMVKAAAVSYCPQYIK
jgi:Protein of unknown function (DUF732)